MRDKNLKIFGGRIRELRKAQGLSQEGLAERAEVHRNFIGFIERGERNVGLRTVIRLSFALGLSLPEIFEECQFVDELKYEPG